MSKKIKEINVSQLRGILAEVYETLEKLQKYSVHINDISLRRAFNGRLCHAKNVIDILFAKPSRNCDKFYDVDEAYEQFMLYVKRENPSCTKASPLHTVWDALKWVLDSGKENA